LAVADWFTLAIGAIGAVIQHFILFLKDIGYSAAAASQYFHDSAGGQLGRARDRRPPRDRFRKIVHDGFLLFSDRSVRLFAK